MRICNQSIQKVLIRAKKIVLSKTQYGAGGEYMLMCEWFTLLILRKIDTMDKFAYYMRKCANISPYIRRPLVKYD